MFTEQKMIQAIIPMGTALPVVKALREEKGLDAANINFARGVGRFVRASERRLGDDQEKEILSIIVPNDRADEIFEWVFETADMDRPHGGIVYMIPLSHASLFQIPSEIEFATFVDEA
ncbi:MAG: P-II family nitrogen regulator [Myxococcota bacterium]|jgi:nitrogen regulatory protein PII|nr:P-II family nitrogen regulator [Myxococcota bacterium]